MLRCAFIIAEAVFSCNKQQHCRQCRHIQPNNSPPTLTLAPDQRNKTSKTSTTCDLHTVHTARLLANDGLIGQPPDPTSQESGQLSQEFEHTPAAMPVVLLPLLASLCPTLTAALCCDVHVYVCTLHARWNS